MPVPGGAVDEDLAGFELAGDERAMNAATSAAIPRKRWTAWTPVMR